MLLSFTIALSPHAWDLVFNYTLSTDNTQTHISASGGITYYVASTGSGTECSVAAPCRQISNALAKVTAGDTILVADGHYDATKITTLHGSVTAPITIKASGSGAIIDPGTLGPASGDNIYIVASSYIIVDGIKSYSAPRAAMFITQSDHITVRHTELANNGVWGILTGHADAITFEYNSIHDQVGSLGQHGIYISNGSTGDVVRYNTIYSNARAGIETNGVDLITDLKLYGNIIYDNAKSVAGTGAFNFLCLKNSQVYNNLLFNNHAISITVSKSSCNAGGPSDVSIYNNTVISASDGAYAIQIKSTTGKITLRNNIFMTANGANTSGGLMFQGASSAADIANTDSDYNLFSDINPKVLAIGGSTLTNTLAEWQLQNHDQHSQSSSPAVLFVNPLATSGYDYHLKNTTLALDTGDPSWPIDIDLAANSRPVNGRVDIGAYEYAASSDNGGGGSGGGGGDTGGGGSGGGGGGSDNGGNTGGGSGGSGTGAGSGSGNSDTGTSAPPANPQTNNANTGGSTAAPADSTTPAAPNPAVLSKHDNVATGAISAVNPPTKTDIKQSYIRADGSKVLANGVDKFTIVVGLKNSDGNFILKQGAPGILLSGGQSHVGKWTLTGNEWLTTVSSTEPGIRKAEIKVGKLSLGKVTLPFEDPNATIKDKLKDTVKSEPVVQLNPSVTPDPADLMSNDQQNAELTQVKSRPFYILWWDWLTAFFGKFNRN